VVIETVKPPAVVLIYHRMRAKVFASKVIVIGTPSPASITLQLCRDVFEVLIYGSEKIILILHKRSIIFFEIKLHQQFYLIILEYVTSICDPCSEVSVKSARFVYEYTLELLSLMLKLLRLSKSSCVKFL
jgi:hypothetical protein